MAGYGRPLLCTDELIDQVEKLLPTVLYLDTVCDYLGIDRQTVGRWIKEGKREDHRIHVRGVEPSEAYTIKQWHKFYLVYKKALASGEIYDAGVIRKAADKVWQAAAWRLERRFPEKWSADRRLIKEMEMKIAAMEKVINQYELQAGGTNDTPEAPGESPPQE
jgi:hypothetical protein